MKRILVIGAGAAGLAAATRAKRSNPQNTVTVLEATQEFSRGTCSLPYYLSGEITDLTSLQGVSQSYLNELGIDLKLGHCVSSIDPMKRIVHCGREGFDYDSLIVSTGSIARPVTQEVANTHHPRLWQLRTIADAERIRRQLSLLSQRNVAVVGGGYLGIELAESLTLQGCRVTLFHRQATLANLSEFCHRPLLQLLHSKGIQVRLKSDVLSVDLESPGETIRFRSDGLVQTAPYQAVCLATGIHPEASLLSAAGAKLGKLGGVLVNPRGETSLREIYACGDGVELIVGNPIFGDSRYIPLATVAAKMGRVCGENASGGHQELTALVGTLSVRVFDHQLGLVGQPQDWRGCESLEINWGPETHAFARRRSGRAVLFTKTGSGRLKGGHFFGPEIEGLVNLVSLAIQQKMTLSDFQDSDFSYTPPLSSLWHPLQIAARVKTKTLQHPIGVTYS